MTVDTVQLSAGQRAALDLLGGAQRVLLTGHEAPDGDCVGAQAALSRLLRALGKEVWVINPDPVEAKYDYLSEPCDMRVYRGGDLPAHDVACLLDGCELSRTGRLAQPLGKARSRKIVIDHHVAPEQPWWDAAFADETASATGLLVWRMAEALGEPLDRIACEGVFTSIVTDTGWFRYSNTDAETLRVASQLVGRGLSPALLFERIFQQRRPGYPRHVARVLERVAYHADGRLAVVDVPIDGSAPEQHEMDDILDVLRSVRGVEVVLLLRETGDGTCKLSARSKTGYDVSALARRFGGGGHVKASGASVRGDLGEVQAALVEVAAAELEAGA